MKKLLLLSASIIMAFVINAQTFADLVEESNKAVVTIYVVENNSTGNGDRFTKTAAEGLGSGVIVGKNSNWVLTAAHVVNQATEIMVELQDGRTISAKTRRISNLADVALIKLDKPATGIKPAIIGNSDSVRVGDDVFIIGSPLGLSNSVSKGIIGGKHSEKQLTSDMPMMEFFQTDASINQGNSGGPMFNMKGEVVGIVSSILSFSGGFEGLGFAASSNIAKQILLQQSSVWFGLDALPMTPELCSIFNVPQEGALLIQNVAENSPAYFMGMKGGYLKMNVGTVDFMAGGDIILSFDNITLDSMEKIEELRAYLNTLEKYHKYKIKVLRNGQVKDLHWQLTE